MGCVWRRRWADGGWPWPSLWTALERPCEIVLKHNLNARALGALTKELDGVQTEVTALIADLQASIAEADAFIQSME